MVTLLPQLPSAASGDPVIAAAGDIVCDPASSSYNGGNGDGGDCTAKATASLLSGVDAVLPLGDNQYNCGGLSAYNQAYDPTWGQQKSISHPVPGNHEFDTSGGTGCGTNAAGYFAYFGAAAGDPAKGYYSYDMGDWHIAALNSHPCFSNAGCPANSAQVVWLRNDLAANAGKCLLAYWHEPRFASKTSGGDPDVSPFWDVLYAAKVDVVLNGHAHWYERFGRQNPSGQPDPNGIREFVVGTGGSGLMPLSTRLPTSEASNGSTHGVLKLVLHNGSYDWNFVPQAGGTFTDAGTTSCHSATSPPTTTVAPTTTTVAPTTTTVAPTTTTVAPTTTTVPGSGGSYRDVVFREPGLMSYWRLGETGGTTAVDSKAVRNGTYLNGVTLGAQGAVTNDPDAAVSLNGSTTKISLPTLPSVTDFSIEGWSYLAEGATANENGNNTLYGTKGNVRLVPRPGLGRTATAAYSGVWLNGTEYVLQPDSTHSNLGTWVQWVLTRSGGTLSLYCNGVRIGRRTDLPASATANPSGWIGAQGGNNYFLNGRVDDVSIYSSALSDSAVESHYNAAISGPAPG